MHRIVNGKKVAFTKAEIAARLEDEASLKIEAMMCCRKKMYGDVGAQLDMLFHELATKGSIDQNGEWFKHIQSVKNMNPKEMM